VNSLGRDEPKYVSSSAGKLRQGEILSSVIQVRQAIDTIGDTQSVELDQLTHPYAIILSQDCDLETDFGRVEEAPQKGMMLPNVLLCEAFDIPTFKARCGINSTLWSNVKINANERFHCLESVPLTIDATGKGIVALGIDFRRYFTIPSNELYKRVAMGEAVRRCKLVSPYLEHFSDRFFQYQARIALPDNHNVGTEVLPAPQI
jgi:hypothetical protein